MPPIEGVSNIVRMPRLGKIRLGIKVERPGKTPYPQPTDYFVVPEEIAKAFSEKPTELEIMFPTENPDQFAQQWYRRYSLTMGLVCIGDGVTARARMDRETGALAGRGTKDWGWEEGLTCNPQDCPEYLEKRCKRVMNLQVLIPLAPGLGIWQIDTSSFHSIVNINTMIMLLKNLAGRCSFIPLKLCLGPIEVTPPGQTKKTVHVMHIKKDMTLADIARLGQRPAPLILIPEPEVEEVPEDLFPPEVLEEEPPQEVLDEPPAEKVIEGAPLFSERDEAIAQIKRFFKRKGWHQTTCDSWLLKITGYRRPEECPDEMLEKALLNIEAQLPL